MEVQAVKGVQAMTKGGCRPDEQCGSAYLGPAHGRRSGASAR